MDPQTKSALRILLLVGGNWLASHGYANSKDIATFTDPNVIEAALGLLTTIATAVWALWDRRPQGILKSASKVLGTDGVIVAPKSMADKLPKNVVPSLAEAEDVAPPAAKRAPRHPPHVTPPAANS